MPRIHRIALCILAGMFAASVQAGPLRDYLKERRAARQPATANEKSELESADGARGRISLPSGASVKRDLAYGRDAQQKLDVYIPKGAQSAPIIIMVHGGAWMFGDKGNAGVVDNKINRWLPKGYLYVSVNYRKSKSPNPLDQADDVGRALAFVQAHASDWGGDASRIVLMGHSAGAHLVALVAADPQFATRYGGRPWLATIPLDSAALDVVEVMERKHYGFYDRVFGTDRDFWIRASPTRQLKLKPQPMLLVCSSGRKDSCPAARKFANDVTRLGGRAIVLPVDLNHGAILGELGNDGAYTTQIESFMQSVGMP